MFSKIGFIGFGLIGGSIARAVKESAPGTFISAFNYRDGKPGAGLVQAYEDKVLDEITDNLSDYSDCDCIILCAPVLTNIRYLKELKDIIKPSCIITDVGSVKGNIHEAAKEIGISSNFIGGHPMAGSEKTGYANSYAALLENAYYVLTPCEDTSEEMLNKMIEFVKSTKALCMVLDPHEHDDVTAAISHVPHIIAAQLVNMVRCADSSDEKMRSLAAGGFKDITRIASSSPVMWQNICLTNTASIRRFIKEYIASLENVVNALDTTDEEYLYNIFEEAGIYRNSIPNQGRGMMNRVFELYMDITDEPGAIASIATLLAANDISIKNIGIIHNREFEQGVLRIEFYKEEPLKRAVRVLSEKNYRIFERA